MTATKTQPIVTPPPMSKVLNTRPIKEEYISYTMFIASFIPYPQTKTDKQPRHKQEYKPTKSQIIVHIHSNSFPTQETQHKQIQKRLQTE